MIKMMGISKNGNFSENSNNWINAGNFKNSNKFWKIQINAGKFK